MGDTLQFIRYIPRVRAAGGDVRVEVQQPLVPLLTESGFGSYLVDAPPPIFDLHCPLLSLPGLLPGDKRPFWEGPYLRADAALTGAWAPRLQAIAGLKVGIAWAGNPQHPHDRYRSAALTHFAPLAALEGVALISLQKGAGSEQASSQNRRFEVIELPGLDERGGALMDTAAVMQHLDLVVTVDTSIAHLAGALGVQTWLALEFSPDWRWLESGDTTAWYPSMRLFRQPAFDDWQPVFADIATALRERMARETHG
jgi:hypothetical protein